MTDLATYYQGIYPYSTVPNYNLATILTQGVNRNDPTAVWNVLQSLTQMIQEQLDSQNRYINGVAQGAEAWASQALTTANIAIGMSSRAVDPSATEWQVTAPNVVGNWSGLGTYNNTSSPVTISSPNFSNTEASFDITSLVNLKPKHAWMITPYAVTLHWGGGKVYTIPANTKLMLDGQHSLGEYMYEIRMAVGLHNKKKLITMSSKDGLADCILTYIYSIGLVNPSLVAFNFTSSDNYFGTNNTTVSGNQWSNVPMTWVAAAQADQAILSQTYEPNYFQVAVQWLNQSLRFAYNAVPESFWTETVNALGETVSVVVQSLGEAFVASVVEIASELLVFLL